MSTAELKEIVANIAKSQAETALQMKDTDRLIKETSIQMKETDRQMKETDRQMKETSIQMKDTDKKIKKLEDLFTGQWGKLVEALVDAGLPRLFQGVGIAVSQVSRRHEILSDGQKLAEIDILLHNGGEDIAIEVKTTCRPKDVDEHIERMKKVHDAVPKYANNEKKLFGAVAALRFEANADLYAKRKGLFLLEGKEGLFNITNAPGFSPKAY